ncbi:MAG: hypothetical protein LBS08_01325 [Candidatus Symbiothrix sp.]|jgi:hypothetical protein|nr:hypothetical protein [Candidatus Symbiothrix sp.]
MEETYSFVKIEYYADDDCIEFPSFDIPTITYFNGTDVEQTFPFDQWTVYYTESSHFVTDDWDSFFLEGIKGIALSVPVNIDEYNNIYLGNKKWEYSLNVQTRKPEHSFSTDVNIPPKTVAIIECRLFLKQYKTSYKLFLKENQTKKEKIIEGIWTGTYLDHPQIDIQYYDL